MIKILSFIFYILYVGLLSFKKIYFVLLFTVKLRAANIIKYDTYNDLVMINGIEKCFLTYLISILNYLLTIHTQKKHLTIHTQKKFFLNLFENSLVYII